MKHLISSLLLLMAAATTASAQVTIVADDGSRARVLNNNVSVTADHVVVSFDMLLDSLRVPSNRYRAFTPVLRASDGSMLETRFKTIIVSGRTQNIIFERDGMDERYASNYVNIRRNNGTAQTYNYTDAVERLPWHDTADLLIEADLCGCGKQKGNDEAFVQTLVKPNPYDLIALANMEPSADKRSQELHGTAFITFVVNKWELKPDYMNNPVELRKITDTLDIMVSDPNVTVEQIKIHGWASPESPYAHNAMLAQNRAQSLTDWVRQKYGLPASAFAPAESTPENWPGLRQAVEQLTTDVLPHRDDILAIIQDVNLDPDPKEQRIKQRYPADYQFLLQNIYPTLRRSDYEITFRVRTFNTDEECIDIYQRKPQQLSLYEFWRVSQTMEPFSDQYNRCMQMALNYYPDEPAAMINLANVALQQGDLLKAETLLQQAGDGGAAENARAVLSILRGNYDEAATHLDNAQRLGVDVTRNREAINILKP